MNTATNTIRTPLLTEAATAEYLSVSIRTVQAWRLRGGGPLYVKLGKSVRYRPADLEQWVEQNLTANTSAEVGAGLSPK